MSALPVDPAAVPRSGWRRALPLLVLAGFVLLASGLILRLRQERLHPGAADPTPLGAADQKELRALQKRAAVLEG